MSLKFIDLTHTLTETAPTWDGHCGFHLTTDHDYLSDSPTVSFKVQSMSMPCGMGTHIDAPAHCFKGLSTIDQIPLDYLINSGYLIDISHRLHADNYLTVNDILEFEEKNGVIHKNSCILINTGWHRHWNDARQYHNEFRFPYIHKDAAELLSQRKIRAVGIDTLSPDRPDNGYPVHELLLSQTILIIENINNLNQLPSKNFTVTLAPLNVYGATESPVRMWATL